MPKEPRTSVNKYVYYALNPSTAKREASKGKTRKDEPHPTFIDQEGEIGIAPTQSATAANCCRGLRHNPPTLTSPLQQPSTNSHRPISQHQTQTPPKTPNPSPPRGEDGVQYKEVYLLPVLYAASSHFAKCSIHKLPRQGTHQHRNQSATSSQSAKERLDCA